MKGKDEDKPVLYRGEVTISLSRAHQGTSYKYLVVEKEKKYWEDLSEFSPHNVYANRGLRIPRDCIKAGGE